MWLIFTFKFIGFKVSHSPEIEDRKTLAIRYSDGFIFRRSNSWLPRRQQQTNVEAALESSSSWVHTLLPKKGLHGKALMSHNLRKQMHSAYLGQGLFLK